MAKMTDDGQRAQVARKTTLVSVVVNLFLSSAQVLAGVFSGSQGLIADGIHSLSDLVADFVVLLANKKSGKPSDSDHHYGHRRYENGASLVIGALLLLVGAVVRLRQTAASGVYPERAYYRSVGGARRADRQRDVIPLYAQGG